MVDFAKWEPSAETLRLAETVLALIKDRGYWVAPALGVFRVEKETQTLVQVEQQPGYDAATLRRTIAVFRKMGWTVREKMDV